jgi:hypothetical protein
MIKASTYRESLEHGQNEAYVELETRIDRAIVASQLDGGSAIRIAVAGVPLRVRDRAIREYRANGWTVDEHFDSRDGDYVELTA